MWTVLENQAARRIVAAAALLGMFAAACGGARSDKFQYKDPDDLALFEVPDDWHVYEDDALSAQALLPFVTDFGDIYPISTKVAFDAAPGRNVANLAQPVSSVRYPVGAYVVRDVSRDERDLLSRAILETLILRPQFYTVLARGTDADFDFGNEYEGIERVIGFADTVTGERGLVAYISVTNPDDSLIYAIAVGCAEDCYEQFEEDIIEVIDSWIVNTKK